MDLFDVLTLIGGLCLFLFGMNVMGEALESRAGNKLRTLLSKMTTGKFAVLGASCARFLCGAGALQLERGTARTVILAVVFAGLLTIAGVQTFRRMKNKE